MEQRWLREVLPVSSYTYLIGGKEDERARLFSVVPTDRTRGNGHKLKTVKLNTRKHFFTVRVTEHWNRSPRFVLEPPSLIIFKT